MTFSIRNDGDRVVIRLPGQLVESNRQVLKQHVVDELGRGARRFLIDFRDTGYVDSAGLGVLVSSSKHIRQHSGELRLAHLSDDIKTVFRLTKLDQLFHIDDDDSGSAGRPAHNRPRPPGPREGPAETEWPDATSPER